MPFVTPLPALLFAVLAPALAGTLVVETTLATEVSLGGLSVVRTYGPGTVTVPDVEAGVHALTVHREGEAAVLEVRVPAEGRVRLLVSADRLEIAERPAAAVPTEGPAPAVELRPEPGQRFTVILDGKRVAVMGPSSPLRLEDLGPGEHRLELRTIDNTTVWARGLLVLQPGDEVSLAVAEGKPVQVFGRAEAWQPSR